MQNFNELSAIKAINNKNNISIAAILREIGLPENNDTGYKSIYNTVEKYNLDISHWKGRGSNKGKNRHDISEYLDKGRGIKSRELKKRLFQEGIKQKKCESCGNDKWLNNDIPLELHHIDGNHFNNKLENLQILCPNCHSFTPNFCSKNKFRACSDKS